MPRDESWLRRIWLDHADAVHRYVRRRTPWLDADDLTSETYLVTWRRRDDVPDHALPWLLGTVRNLIGTRLRAQGRERDLLSILPTEHAAAQDVATSTADRLDLLDAWHDLEPSDREVLALVAWEGLSNADAGATLGLSGPTFAVRLHRARSRLESQLSRESTPDGTRTRRTS
ncbi:MAG: sigma-70 family RNA polymerase sigma factor [Salana multivorans]|uniref:RNA polymerase sigma factor n=1 Tax=Salana multivorans TaxID=120377 RepID=UPI000967C16A|nr:sigma-70 family RNA polymerase sigma factor [Salana multivorans]MBN8881877.1 sigma-70 family RNA polymerase sigma factor [Salana multivorans]OJX97509.1 MAG: hypothetical protein BGO96_06330 [Micrococcales bacterium 73-15]